VVSYSRHHIIAPSMDRVAAWLQLAATAAEFHYRPPRLPRVDGLLSIDWNYSTTSQTTFQRSIALFLL